MEWIYIREKDCLLKIPVLHLSTFFIGLWVKLMQIAPPLLHTPIKSTFTHRVEWVRGHNRFCKYRISIPLQNSQILTGLQAFAIVCIPPCFSHIGFVWFSTIMKVDYKLHVGFALPLKTQFLLHQQEKVKQELDIPYHSFTIRDSLFYYGFVHNSNPTVIYLNICSNSSYLHCACNVVEAQATHPVSPKRNMTLICCLDVWYFFDFPVFLASPR